MKRRSSDFTESFFRIEDLKRTVIDPANTHFVF
jgi:hypothetical protein